MEYPNSGGIGRSGIHDGHGGAGWLLIHLRECEAVCGSAAACGWTQHVGRVVCDPSKIRRLGWPVAEVMHVPPPMGLIPGQSMNQPIILLAYTLLPWVGVKGDGRWFTLSARLLVQPKEGSGRQWNFAMQALPRVAFGMWVVTNLSWGDTVPRGRRRQPRGGEERTTMAIFMNDQSIALAVVLLVTLAIAALIATDIEICRTTRCVVVD